MKYTAMEATARVLFALEGAPATMIPFDVNGTEFVPDFCGVQLTLDVTDGPHVTKVELSGPRILQSGKQGRAVEHALWKLSEEVGGLFPDPPPHVQELADAAINVVVRQMVGIVEIGNEEQP